MLEQLKEGWTYVSGFAPIRTILLLFAIVSLMGWPFTVLMPIFAAKVLQGGPHTLGFLMAAMGVGALVSAVSLAVRKTVLGLGRMIPLSAGAFGVGLIFFGLSRNLWISLALMLVCGFRIDAADGRQQHDYSDDCRRKQTRPGDEFLYHGVCGHGAIWEFAGGQPGQLDWRAEDGDANRDVLRNRSDLVRFEPADDSAAHSAHLRDLGIVPPADAVIQDSVAR